jgi:hypothetical protein
VTDFAARFEQPLDEESINGSHQIVIVAATLDASSERIVGYLNERGVAIHVLFLVFNHGNGQLLSRAWLIDPGDVQIQAATSASRGEKEPWTASSTSASAPVPAPCRDYRRGRLTGAVTAADARGHGRFFDLARRRIAEMDYAVSATTDRAPAQADLSSSGNGADYRRQGHSRPSPTGGRNR